MTGGATRCGDCGAQICQQMCSRLNRKFADHWCCLFCYQKRLWLYKNHWINSLDRRNIESDFFKSLTETHICRGESRMAPVGQLEDCDKLEVHTQKLNSNAPHSTVTDIHVSKPLSIKMVEESIEEITDYIVEDNHMNHKWEQSVNIRKSHRVPFPEFGVDIVDAYQETPETIQNKTIDSDTVTSVNFSENWKENWLFRKKQCKAYSNPVAMFVPNSKTKYRALIGDTDADETSDLSEYSTHSDEEIELELKLPIKNDFSKNPESDSVLQTITDTQAKVTVVPITVEHQTSSGIPKNTRNGNLKSTSETCLATSYINNIDILNSNVSSKGDLVSQNINPKYELNSSRLAQSTVSSSIVDQHSSELQEDTEKIDNYTINEQQLNRNCKDDYKGAVQYKHDIHVFDNIGIPKSDLHSVSERLEKDSSPNQSSMTISNQNDQRECSLNNKQNSVIEINLSAPPKPGTIADREHKKWENAIPMKNNPYSKDNIHKRLEQKRYSSVLSDISGRNYYVRNNSSTENGTSYQIIDVYSNSTELKENVPDIVHDKPLQKIIEKESEASNNGTSTTIYAHRNRQSRREPDKIEQNIEGINAESQDEPIGQMEIKNAFKVNALSKSCVDISDVTITAFDDKSDDGCSTDANNSIKSGEIDYKDKELITNRSLKDKILLFDHHRIKPISMSLEDFSKINEVDKISNNISNDVQLPSVKELVQVFNEKEQKKSVTMKPKQLNELKTDQSSSRQNQVNQSPKQLHSLTARSLSKEFREGLRQIPNKANSNGNDENHFK